MKEKLLNIDDIVSLLREEVKTCGSQEAFAAKAGVTQQYVGDILRGQRAPGQKILDALGIEKIAYYVRRPVVRVHRKTWEIEIKVGNAPWGSVQPHGWSFDRENREFVLEHVKNKKTRYPLSKQQNDPEYLYGDIALGLHGEIVITGKD